MTDVKKPAVKKPQDHQPKKPAVKKIDGGVEVTLHGAVLTVQDDARDDFELLEDLRAIDVDQNPSRLPAILRRLVGADGYAAAMEAVRDKKTGRVTIEAGTGLIKDLFEAINPNS